MDMTPLGHSLAAVGIQITIGVLTGQWFLGGVVGCTWFIAREHTQTEYRWITLFGRGKRANMPWWGGFSLRAWDMASLMDWIAPVIACTSIYFAIT